MVNSELKITELGPRGTAMSTFDKQMPSTIKKVALTDLQNANRNLMGNHQEGSQLMEQRPIADVQKFYEMKRSASQNPSVHPLRPTLSITDVTEHLKYAQNKYGFEPEQHKIQSRLSSTVNHAIGSESRPFWQQDVPGKPTEIRRNYLHYVPSVIPNHVAPNMTFSTVPPSLPSSLDKHTSKVGASASETPRVSDSKIATDRKWEKRYINLQNKLKRIDESDNSALIQGLRQLSPADLSLYASELEKQAIQLAVEEGKEMQRMKALNIFGKSPPNMDPREIAELLKTMK